MTRLFKFINKKLSYKILLALSAGGVLVMSIVIYLSISSQRHQIRNIMATFSKELNYLAYAGIKHPMAVGDSNSVKQQFIEVKELLKNTEIVICDFNQKIVFATHEDKINSNVSDFIHNKEALTAFNSLETISPAEERYYEEEVEGTKYLITIHPMANAPECHHCHGDSRKVLGGLIVRQSTDETYAAITALRNRTIFISVIGLIIIILIIYALLNRLVTRPVTLLADTAEQLASGDMTVSVPVTTTDSIGTLGESFNDMAASIKAQMEFANSLKEAIADPLFMVDTNMIITYMNRACSQLTGYDREEVIGKMTCRQIFKSDLCQTTCPILHCLRTGEAVEGIRPVMTDRSGNKIPLMASASALRNAQGELIGGVEICRDISDLLEAERLHYIKKAAKKEAQQRKSLEKRTENLLSILSQASEGNLQVRAEVTESEEVMDEIARHMNHMLENLEKMYEKISSFSKELKKEVAQRTIMLREKTTLLESANRELRELDRLKNAFLANMSHELRTPMNSIIGYTELILDGVDGEINEEQEKSLLKVENNAKHLLQLINDVLDMAKIESGKIKLTISETDIEELIRSVVVNFEETLNRKGLTLSLKFASDLPHVFIDQDKIKQVIINLLSNAIKFTHKGGIEIEASIHELEQKNHVPSNFLTVKVTDTGIGIHESDISKLFNKFDTIDNSTTRQYEGTGLGLSIARGLIVLHKGAVWAESKLNKGTTFHFTLPISQETLKNPPEPIIEPIMAKKLAQHFNKAESLFYKNAQYAGKPLMCWEYTRCGQSSCPAFEASDLRCWMIVGTHCKGTKIASFTDKFEFCINCDVLDRVNDW